MGGGLTDWHRQKRKKELQKNKEKRIAERDARVLQTKSVESVQAEIRAVERQHKVKKDEEGNEIPLPHAIKSKLDRLKKELRILQESDKGQDKSTVHKASQKAAKEWKPLDNPQLSIYYDPVMNPFGEPPPGQPRLYHTRDGRTTFNLQEAALPGSAPPPPPPPPESNKPSSKHNTPQKMPPDDHRPAATQKESYKHNHKPKSTNVKRPATAPNPHQVPVATDKAPVPAATPAAAPAVATKPQSTKPKEAPSLPAPSQAVKRGRSRLKADIWASSEEIDYHQQSDHYVALEGTTADALDEASITQWWYQDQQKQTQGPFAHEQMVAWIQAGFFPRETRARPRDEGPWKPLFHYKILRAVLGEDETPNEIAAESAETSLEDRITALKKEHQQTSVADRIAALRGDAPQPVADDWTGDNQAAREDALPPPPNTAQELPAYSIAKDDISGPEPESDLPLPPPPAAGAAPEMAAYVVNPEDAMPLPPPPAVGGMVNELPVYPVNESGDNDYMPAYPLADAAYPAVDDVPVTDDYPVVDAYPTAEDATPSVPPPKKAKVDKAVVSFLPTHLRKRKK